MSSLLDSYRKQLTSGLFSVNSPGTALKKDALTIEEFSFDEDINAMTAYFYDFYHDTNKTVLNNLQPFRDENKIPIRIKFLKHASQSYDKNAVTYRIQFKPSQECTIPYYKEFFEDMYDAQFPCGLYLDIEDVKGHFNRWLVVGFGETEDDLFPTYEILRCNYVIQYIKDGIKYNVPAVLRSQSSYNSGIWSGLKITTEEDRQQFVVPMNRETEKIFYNDRMLIDTKVVNRSPRAWQISKVNAIQNKGLNLCTLSQVVFNPETDYVEFDEKGNVIGLWANYYSEQIQAIDYDCPELPPAKKYTEEITYSGSTRDLRIKGSSKKFTVNYFLNNESATHSVGEWKFSLYLPPKCNDGKQSATIDPVTENLLQVEYPETNPKLNSNQVSLVFTVNRDLFNIDTATTIEEKKEREKAYKDKLKQLERCIGSILTISNESSDVETSGVDINIIAL